MNKTALFVRHRAKPGKRDEVRRVWEKYVQPRAADISFVMAEAGRFVDELVAQISRGGPGTEQAGTILPRGKKV